MVLQLDFTKKVVTLNGTENIKEVIDHLKGCVPNWKEWKLEGGGVDYITYYPYDNPWCYPYNPPITYTTSGSITCSANTASVVGVGEDSLYVDGSVYAKDFIPHK